MRCPLLRDDPMNERPVSEIEFELQNCRDVGESYTGLFEIERARSLAKIVHS
ncbi:MAG: hypothetical protein VW935_18420 [Novosphingobium sp.]